MAEQSVQRRLAAILKEEDMPSVRDMARGGLTRRALILAAPSLLVSGAALAALAPTPGAGEGPFYPVRMPSDDDADLVRVEGAMPEAGGDILHLAGRVLDTNARPIAGVRIEIWQCDANGRYHHPRDSGHRSLDEYFQGFGRTLTDTEGRYRFRTIRPVPYPGRAPHIHVAVFPPAAEPFVTQLYVKDEPRNAHDFIFNSIPAERRQFVLAAFSPTKNAEAELSANFDIVLGGGTPAG